LEELQGLLALVDEEDGIVLIVEVAEEFVGVVCPYTQPDIKESAAVIIINARIFSHLFRNLRWQRILKRGAASRDSGIFSI
jgi:hypothetical protein